MEAKLVMESSHGPLRLEVVGEGAQYPKYSVIYAKCRDEDDEYCAGSVAETYSKPFAVFTFRALSRLLGVMTERERVRTCKVETISGDEIGEMDSHACCSCGEMWKSYRTPRHCPGCGARIVEGTENGSR